jgi:hypothetical protein
MTEPIAPIGTHLLSATLRGFRSIREPQELRVEPELTILAGRNNVGKTAFLHALTLPTTSRPGMHASFELTMKWLIAGDDLRSALQVQTWSVSDITNELRACDALELEVTVRAQQAPLSLPVANPPAGRDSLMGAGLEISSIRIGGGLLSFARKLVSHSNPPNGTFTWADATNPSLHSVSFLPESALNLSTALFASIFYVGPRRTCAPRVQLTGAGELAADGSNLTNVLADLYTNHRHTAFPLTEAFIKDAFPEVAHIDVRLIQTGSGPQAEVHVVYPGAPGDEVPLEHCGTGIEQLLMLGAAILSSTRARVFLIDEPHAFLHPHAERSLLRLMRAHPQHQYIVATHSSVFLRSAGLFRVRLLLRGERGTVIKPFDAAADLLTELGITATDLWSSEAILWVEGPTEVAIYEVLGELEPDLMAGVLVKSMPDYVRSAASKPSRMHQFSGMVGEVTDALSPLAVRTRFLFDRDETDEARRSAVIQSSSGLVEFLPCREVENLLVSAPSVARIVNRRRAELDLGTVADDQVSDRIENLLADLGSNTLYPLGAEGPDRNRIRGSRLLQELFVSFGGLEYDKVRDGRALATEIAMSDPDALSPLRNAISHLMAS